jgi:hypothetical protein
MTALPSSPPRITAPLSGRVVVRAPFRTDMRARLTRCGGVPQWEAELEVWTMPRSTLQLVVTEVVATYARAVIAIEVRARIGSTWLRYEVVRGQEESVIERLGEIDVIGTRTR